MTEMVTLKEIKQRLKVSYSGIRYWRENLSGFPEPEVHVTDEGERWLFNWDKVLEFADRNGLPPPPKKRPTPGAESPFYRDVVAARLENPDITMAELAERLGTRPSTVKRLVSFARVNGHLPSVPDDPRQIEFERVHGGRVCPLPSVEIWTDASVSGSPQTGYDGGWAAILQLGQSGSAEEPLREISGAFPVPPYQPAVTRAELFAAISGIGAVPEPSCITLFSDSLYVVETIKAANGSRKRYKTNRDLAELLSVKMVGHHVLPLHVQGHKHSRRNRMADAAARKARIRGKLETRVRVINE